MAPGIVGLKPISLALVLLSSISLPVGGQTAGSIEILQPVEWASATPRSLAATPRTSLRVEGIIRHPQGVDAVLLNGKRASLQAVSSERTRFMGFVEVQAGSSEVSVEVKPVTGGAFSRNFPLGVEAAERGLAVRERPGALGERWAVIVGISDYQDPEIPDLQFASADARAVYDFLRSPAAGLDGFKEENILLLLDEDATYQAIRHALFTFLKSPTDEDLVVVYFAGHGTPDADRMQNLYLLTHDSRLEDISSTAFPMGDVQDAISQTYFRHLVLLTDACHSAGVGSPVGGRSLGVNAINEVFLERLESSMGGYVAVTASQVNQLSRESTQWGGGHGAFTHFLLEALRGAADEDEDRIVTLLETTEYIREQVRRATRNAQIPTISQTAFDNYLPLAVVLTPPEEEAAPLGEEAAATAAEPVAEREPSSLEGRPRPQSGQPEASEGDPPLSGGSEAEFTTRGLFNPTQEATKSFFIPGLGQASTGRKFPALGFLAGYAGTLGIGLLVTETDIQCASPNPVSCPDEDILSKKVDRPYLGVSVGAAIAISVISAWDAHRGARQANERTLDQARGDPDPPRVQAGPRLARGPGRALAVEWFRVRF